MEIEDINCKIKGLALWAVLLQSLVGQTGKHKFSLLPSQ